MNRVQMITHKGKNIVLIDVVNCLPAETLQVLPAAQKIISQLPAKSALVLTDVSGATYDKEVAAAIKDFATKNTPYVRASAVVGADGVRQILLQTVILITRREMKTFSSREQAKDWLASL